MDLLFFLSVLVIMAFAVLAALAAIAAIIAIGVSAGIELFIKRRGGGCPALTKE